MLELDMVINKENDLFCYKNGYNLYVNQILNPNILICNIDA